MNSASQEYEWYLAREGQRYGPITDEDFQQLISQGQLKPEDLVWRAGFTEWMLASDIPGLLEDEEPALGVHPSSMSSPEEETYNNTDTAQSDFVPESPIRGEAARNGSARNEMELRAEPLFDRQFSDDNATSADYAAFNQLQSEPKQRKSFARRFFSLVLVLLIFGGIALFALPAVIPADFIREHIARIVKEQTGRTLTVRGKSTFSLVPYVGIRMHDVSLSNPPNMAGESLVQMSSFEVQLKLMPLLEQKIEVQRFILKEPQVSLRVDGRGNVNWDFSAIFAKKASLQSPYDSDPIKTADTSKPIQGILHNLGIRDAYGSSSLTSPALGSIKLREIRIIDGSLSYYDEKSGFNAKLNAINSDVSLPLKSDNMIVGGTALWRNESINCYLSMSTPELLISGGKVPYNLHLKSSYFSSILSGELSWADGFYVTGAGSELQVNSLRKLSSWLDHEIAPGSGMEAFNVRGNFVAQSHRINITNATIALDDTTANGEASVILSGKRPYVSAKLSAETINLNPYFREVSLKESSFLNPGLQLTGPGSQDGQIRRTNQENVNTGSFVTSQLEEKNTENSQISARPINTFASSLDVFDADIQINSDQILYEQVLVGKSKFEMEVRSGILNAKTVEMGMYSGAAKGSFQVSSKGALPEFTGNFKLTNVSALQFMKAAYNFGWISGKADMEIDFKSSGHSSKQIVSELVGKGKITLHDGAIEGINIAKTALDLQQGAASTLTQSSSDRTKFKTLTATFVFDKGVANNRDLIVDAQELKVKGQGVIDFGQGLIDYQIETKGSSESSGTDKIAAIPVRIKGPLESPNIKLDVHETIAKNKDALYKGLVSGTEKEADPPRKNENPDNFESLIKGVLSKSGGSGTN